MPVTAAMVRSLSQQTGAGFADCRQALDETGGDQDKAGRWLKYKGIAVSERRFRYLVEHGPKETPKKGERTSMASTDLISRVEAAGMPHTLADAIYAGFTPDQWRQLRIDASMDHCADSGRCHGAKRFCLYCGKVDKTCDLPGCAIHKDAVRCGKKIATTSGWRICA